MKYTDSFVKKVMSAFPISSNYSDFEQNLSLTKLREILAHETKAGGTNIRIHDYAAKLQCPYDLYLVGLYKLLHIGSDDISTEDNKLLGDIIFILKGTQSIDSYKIVEFFERGNEQDLLKIALERKNQNAVLYLWFDEYSESSG